MKKTQTTSKETSATGKGCTECGSRKKEEFQRQFPWSNIKKVPSQEDIDFVKTLKDKLDLTQAEATRLINVYNDWYEPLTPLQFCNCPGMFKTIIQRLNQTITDNE